MLNGIEPEEDGDEIPVNITARTVIFMVIVAIVVTIIWTEVL